MTDLVHGFREYSPGQQIPVGLKTVELLSQTRNRDKGRRSECGPEDEGQFGDIKVAIGKAQDMFLVFDLELSQVIQYHFSRILAAVGIVRLDRRPKAIAQPYV